MRIVIRRSQQDRAGASPALRQFRAVLSSAAETHYYRPWLQAARLLNPDRIQSLASLPEALACVPRVELSWFLNHPSEFRNRHAPDDYHPMLFHPSDPVPRTAVLAAGFTQTGNVRCFDRGDLDGLAKFGPECIAGPLDALLHLARGIRRGRVALPTIRHSVVSFADVRGGLMTEDDRDALWQGFLVPVFEQLRGMRGELLAAECDAHMGLHLFPRDAVIEFDTSRQMPELLFTSLADLTQPAIRLATGWTPRLEEGVCACGSRYPRIADLALIEHARPLAIARAAAC
jgi:hypothetical protein